MSEQVYPFSAGQTASAVVVPAGACDCHLHVYDQRCPAAPGARLLPPDAAEHDYRRIQQRLGTQRLVLVTPSTYGADNRLLLRALLAFGQAARGVAVIRGDESDAELQALHQAGVRGVRANLSLGTLHTAADLPHLAARIQPLGWHLQLLMPVETLVQQAGQLSRLPVPLVFDHFARIPSAQWQGHPAHVALLDLLATGRCWVKLSGGYLISPSASIEDASLDALARCLMGAAPDRVLWGSDWPHATASAGHQPMPDDARQLERLAIWAQTPDTLARILVRNPQTLYGFEPV